MKINQLGQYKRTAWLLDVHCKPINVQPAMKLNHRCLVTFV